MTQAIHLAAFDPQIDAKMQPVLDTKMDHNPKPSKDSEQSEHTVREYESSQLLHGAKEILIRHAGETYRLRLTKNDKLILQK